MPTTQLYGRDGSKQNYCSALRRQNTSTFLKRWGMPYLLWVWWRKSGSWLDFKETPQKFCAVFSKLSHSSQRQSGGGCTCGFSTNATPRNNHIAIKYHHFRSFISKGHVVINHIDTKEQVVDIFTKPLDPNFLTTYSSILMVGEKMVPFFAMES